MCRIAVSVAGHFPRLPFRHPPSRGAEQPLLVRTMRDQRYGIEQRCTAERHKDPRAAAPRCACGKRIMAPGYECCFEHQLTLESADDR